MRVILLLWLSTASSGVPRFEGFPIFGGLLSWVAWLVGGSLGLVGIRLGVVPAGAPINNWNCSSGELVGLNLVKVFGWDWGP